MSKPSWNPVLSQDGKFYTGYQHYINDPRGSNKNCKFNEVNRNHKPQTLILSYNGYGRGRSSVTMNFVDIHGFEYEMTCKGFDMLMKLIFKGEIGLNEGYITDVFKQVKQGQNYAIQVLTKAEYKQYLKQQG